MATADLFPTENASSPQPPSETEPPKMKAPESGLLVTSHLNLMYMLAAGLVMPPAGFGDKYYRDPLECFSGWIPLFIEKVPRDAIESATREAGHLKPTVVQIGLAGMSGNLIAIGDRGPRKLRFPDGVDGTERVLLIPAPLPTSRIESITFQSKNDKQACEADAKEDFANVPLRDFGRRTNRTLFSEAPDTPWPPADGPAERTVPLERPLAVGGAMATVFLFGSLGDQAVRACRDAFDPDEDSLRSPADDHPIFTGLGYWVREGGVPPSASMSPETDRVGLQNALQARLFWEAVERLVRWRDSVRVGSAETALLEHLRDASAGLDKRAQAGVRKLHDTLESLTGLADATASELFGRHDTPLAHALTLFFLRRDCVDLLDYQSDRLGETDWLAAAILFGVRDGWLGLPLRLRAHPGLANAVSHRMAQMSHRIAGTGFDLGDPPARVHPLREQFGDGSAWSASEKAAALELARLQKWDCIHTRISLRPGKYSLTVKGGSAHIDLPGEPKYSTRIDAERFFDLLAAARLDPKTEAKVRAKLPG